MRLIFRPKSEILTLFQAESRHVLHNFGTQFPLGGGCFQFFTKNRPQKHHKRAILHTSQANLGSWSPPPPPAPLATLLALSKKIYVCSEFARNKKNPRKTWEIIRSALPCKPNREPPVAFKETQDPNVIANQFNDYFCSIGSDLVESIICTTRKQPKYFLEKKVSDSIYLELPTNNEILNQITSLKNKAVGHDNIQPFFIKVARFVIAPYSQLIS